MATSAKSSHGTLFQVGDGATPTEAFTTVAEVLDISGPEQVLNTEDATNHDSGGWREPIPTIKEAGEISFELNYYKAASQTSMRTDLLNRTKRNFRVVFPLTPTETLNFSGYVTKFGYTAPVEGILRTPVTIQVTGQITSS